MKRVPLLGWIALVALLIALVVTLAASDWLWSLDGVRAMQSLGGWLKLPMLVFTFLGDEKFYLAFIPVVYWCLQKELGADLGVVLVLSSLTNCLLKSFIKNNRPFWQDPALRLADAGSFSTPSGHSQTTAALLGKLASFFSRSGLRVLWALLLAFVTLCVMLSRVYLGVHFPGDIMWGMVIGLALVSLYNWAKPKLLPRLKSLSLGTHVALALVAAVVIVIVHYGLLMIPVGAGQAFAALYREGRSAALEDGATVAGLVAGLWIGIVVESRYVHFSVAGPWWQRVLRYVIGVVILLGIWLGLDMIFPQQPLALGLTLRVLRYGLAMAWAILGWPWVFVRIGLGRRETGAPGGATGEPPRLAGAI